MFPLLFNELFVNVDLVFVYHLLALALTNQVLDLRVRKLTEVRILREVPLILLIALYDSLLQKANVLLIWRLLFVASVCSGWGCIAY